MPILQQDDRETIRQRFDIELKQDVNITMFTQKDLGALFIPGRECQTCAPTQGLLEEVSELSDKIHLDFVDFYGDPDEAKSHEIERIPATIISGNDSDNVRYYGMR